MLKLTAEQVDEALKGTGYAGAAGTGGIKGSDKHRQAVWRTELDGATNAARAILLERLATQMMGALEQTKMHCDTSSSKYAALDKLEAEKALAAARTLGVGGE